MASDSDDMTTHKDEILPNEPYKTEIVWQNVAKFLVLHSLFLFGLTLLPQLSWRSWLVLVLSNTWAGLGITAGAHRLWAHRTYKVGEFRIEGFSQF